MAMRPDGVAEAGGDGTAGDLYARLPQETDRVLVLFEDGVDVADATAILRRQSGISAHTLAEEEPSEAVLSASEGTAVLRPRLGAAVVAADPEQVSSLRALGGDGTGSGVLATSPESVVWALDERYEDGFADGYARGFRDALGRVPGPVAGQVGAPRWHDDQVATWGLHAVDGADHRTAEGSVRVAVLDTGVDLDHPDLDVAASASFVPGEGVADGNGHGTHCAGVIAGAAAPRDGGARFGVAPGVVLLVGKVLSDRGSGVDGGILDGIDWALGQGAEIISMSLGARRSPVAPYDPVFEGVAARALAAGCWIVAAAGNDSERRFGVVAPVNHPANCPSVAAVAAIDSYGRVADFSNGSISSDRAVDVACPGVAVRSTWRRGAYRTISGTSMATPHVVGVAAAIAARTDLSGAALRDAVLATATPLAGQASADVGAGLVAVPAAGPGAGPDQGGQPAS